MAPVWAPPKEALWRQMGQEWTAYSCRCLTSSTDPHRGGPGTCRANLTYAWVRGADVFPVSKASS